MKGIVLNADEDFTQEEIENIYETTDYREVIIATLEKIVKFTNYELTDYQKEELLFYVNDIRN